MECSCGCIPAGRSSGYSVEILDYLEGDKPESKALPLVKESCYGSSSVKAYTGLSHLLILRVGGMPPSLLYQFCGISESVEVNIDG